MREDGAATRDRVLAASVELLSERGYNGTTMRQLAERAELPISAFYYYYASKYEVLRGIMHSGLDEGARLIADAVAMDLPPREQLAELVRTHVRYHLRAPLVARVVDRELRALKDADLKLVLKRRDAYEQPFREALEAGVRDGSFRADLEVTVVKNLIVTMSTGVIDWWQPRGRLSAETVADLVAGAAIDITESRTNDRTNDRLAP